MSLFVYIFVLHIFVSFSRMEVNYHRRASGLLLVVADLKFYEILPCVVCISIFQKV